MRPTSSRPTGRRDGAFSLVEVTIALGIFVFALVAILGLFPMAVQTSRASLDLFTVTQIANGLASDLGRKPFSDFQSDQSEERFFDGQAREVPASGEAVYQVRVSMEASESNNLLRTIITVSRGGDVTSARTFSYLLFNNE